MTTTTTTSSNPSTSDQLSPPPAATSSSNSTENQQQLGNGRRPDTSATALALLKSQPSHYIVASIYQRSFLLTPRDVVTVPRLKDVKVGQVLALEKIHEVGSRDFTLRASFGEVLPGDLVQCRATVIEHTKGQMEETVKFKRRKGYKKTIKHKARYTRLRVGDITLGGQNSAAEEAQ